MIQPCILFIATEVVSPRDHHSEKRACASACIQNMDDIGLRRVHPPDCLWILTFNTFIY